MPVIRHSDMTPEQRKQVEAIAYINAHQTEQIMPELGSVWLRLAVEIGQWMKGKVGR